ncbi:MAG: prepilin-type N-terminal cleavage/methylation domain-containing protein [Candidatus Electrothrix sp. LOE2]|nr:prepilin-type N-terminal cleavage/methylation domain-containing protein [Candidatus Electrothrix sp. LOE2]
MRTGTEQQGFTLIELIIVMVLISLTASFALPKIQANLYSNELRASAQRFVGLVTEAAQEARAKHVAVALRFDADAKAFLAVPVTAGPETEEEEADKAYLRAKLDDSVTLAGIETRHDNATATTDDTGILFTTKGYTGKTVVHFEGDNGDQVSVILSPFLGVARILEGRVSLDDDRMTVSR